MHINTKVVFEWNPESNEYAEVHSEGFEYEGDVAQCQYTSPTGTTQEQIQAALEQYGIDPSAYGLTDEQMYNLFSQGSGSDIASIFGVQGGEYFTPFNASQFESGLQGIGRERRENTQLGTGGIMSSLLPGLSQARQRTGGFAGGGAQKSFLEDIMGGARQEYGKLQSQVGRDYQGQLGALFGGLEGWLGEQYDVAAGLNPPTGNTGLPGGGGEQEPQITCCDGTTQPIASLCGVGNQPWECEDDDDPNVYGCTDGNASNYNPNATADDGSCEYGESDPCPDPNNSYQCPDGSCVGSQFECL